MADRIQHIRQIIRPALQKGKVVVCDRYVDATIVYQGVARGLKPDTVTGLHDSLLGGLWPDITLLLDLPPEQGLRRAWRQIHNGARGSEESRFEEETMDFHKKIREGYLSRAKAEPNRFRVVNAALPQQEVEAEIERVLSEAIHLRT
jgi:dTMP kinase